MKYVGENALKKVITLFKGVIDTKITNPSGGTNGQILTKTASGEDWQDAPVSLPQATAADNGKVMAVVNGEWSKADAPGGLPSVTTSDDNETLVVKNGVWTKSASASGYGHHLSFSGTFTLKTANLQKNWDGVLEYSTNASVWHEWNGVDVLNSKIGDTWQLNANLLAPISMSRTFAMQVIDADTEELEWNYYSGLIVNPSSETTYVTLCSYYGEDNVEISKAIWTQYINSGSIGKICLVVDYSSTNNFDDNTLNWLNTNGTYSTEDMSGYLDAFYLRGKNNTVITGDSEYRPNSYWVFTTEGNIYCYGNIENLLDYRDVAKGKEFHIGEHCFESMFYNCTHLVTAPNLPSKYVGNYGYYRMFVGCTGLSAPPYLPATNLGQWCYAYMFSGCTSLSTLPALPAKNLNTGCYTAMFADSGVCISDESGYFPEEEDYNSYNSPFKIPYMGNVGTYGESATSGMFEGTQGRFKGTPSTSTIYYTTNYLLVSEDNYYDFKIDDVAVKLDGQVLTYSEEEGWIASGVSLPEVTAEDNGKTINVVSGEWNLVPGLPSVTSSDNTKVLAVVNGQWDKTDEIIVDKGSEDWIAMSGIDDATMWSVTYGDGRFVCVGAEDKAYYSIDGQTWIAMSGLPTEIQESVEPPPDLGSVVYANGKFYCRSDYNLYQSVDGTSWTYLRSAPGDRLYYLNNTLISLKLSFQDAWFYVFMNDEETWSSSVHIGNITLRAMTYGNGRFVCVGDNGKSYYSTDGTSWTAMTGLGSGFSYEDVTYGNGRFVCVGQSGKCYYSTDGETWTTMRGLNGSHYYRAVAYGNNKFVCVSSNKGAAVSDDGETWETCAFPGYVYHYSIIYDGSKFICEGFSSTDGKNWTAIDIDADYNSLAYGGGKYVIVGDNGTYGYSTDLENWTTSSMPSITTQEEILCDFDDVAYGNGKFVCVGSYPPAAAYSTNGQTWISINESDDEEQIGGSNIVYGNDRFICISGESYYSTDGISWTAMTGLGEDEYFQYLVYGNGRFIISNPDNDLLYCSTDGETWEAINISDDIELCKLIYGNGKFISLGEWGDPSYYSTDGETWIAIDGGFNFSDYSVHYGHGKFICLGSDSAYYSIDGENWISMKNPDDDVSLYSCVYGKDKYVGVGNSDALYYTFSKNIKEYIDFKIESLIETTNEAIESQQILI